jgi:hypothetical protein
LEESFAMKSRRIFAVAFAYVVVIAGVGRRLSVVSQASSAPVLDGKPLALGSNFSFQDQMSRSD